MIRVQSILSSTCNLYDFKKAAPFGKSCPYCNIYSPTNEKFITFGSKTIELDRGLSPDEWLSGTRMVCEASNDQILWDFTGGEPTLYKQFPLLLEMIKPYSIWAITSNSLLRRQIEAIKWDDHRCVSWTASWHPNANRSMTDFIDTLKFISSHRVYISVTIVLHESTKHVIKDHLKQIQDAGFRCQIHLFLSEGWSLNKDADEELKSIYYDLKEINKAPTEGWDESPPDIAPIRDCIAGHKSISVASDGKIYLCYEHLMTEQAPPIGKWGEWIPNKDLTRDCTWTCRYACDLRNVIGSPYYVAQ